MEVINPYLITEKKSNEDLSLLLDDYNEKHAGKLVRHVASGGIYRISHFSILSRDGNSEIQANFHPFDELTQVELVNVRHSRPCVEFFDGRFSFSK
ncbi:hypothetical protein [Exiguobacterium sp. s183]|uniref:hypothetical protein n=1 Tax=Exiguobacterium sp. s183 TaxID=2751262 RepID=UPI001BE9FBC0|nr:hypothetical protein [Exiguobacterium sp. s183]